MLQPIQVDTVISYYQKWRKRFPTLGRLANTPRDEVKRFWAILGYYPRVRMLHGGDKDILSPYHGKMPPTAEASSRSQALDVTPLSQLQASPLTKKGRCRMIM